MRDVRALLTLEPNYKMFNAKVGGGQLVDLLSHQVQQTSQAECWMQLYERWSSVDDIGSLAVIHQMLDIEPKRSLLWFRQSLLLLRYTSLLFHFLLNYTVYYYHECYWHYCTLSEKA